MFLRSMAIDHCALITAKKALSAAFISVPACWVLYRPLLTNNQPVAPYGLGRPWFLAKFAIDCDDKESMGSTGIDDKPWSSVSMRGVVSSTSVTNLRKYINGAFASKSVDSHAVYAPAA